MQQPPGLNHHTRLSHHAAPFPAQPVTPVKLPQCAPYRPTLCSACVTAEVRTNTVHIIDRQYITAIGRTDRCHGTAAGAFTAVDVRNQCQSGCPDGLWAGDGRAMGGRWTGDGRAVSERCAGDTRPMGGRYAGNVRAMCERWASVDRTITGDGRATSALLR